jgi:hypothetical protein
VREALETMCDVVERHADQPRQPTIIPGLTHYRMSRSVHPMHVSTIRAFASSSEAAKPLALAKRRSTRTPRRSCWSPWIFLSLLASLSRTTADRTST